MLIWILFVIVCEGDNGDMGFGSGCVFFLCWLIFCGIREFVE